VDTRAAQAASLLLAARSSGVWLESLPETLAPQSMAEAYEIQDSVMGNIGPAGGWKVGARSPDAEPTCAPLARNLIFLEGASLPPALLRLRGVEAEIGFKLAADLPPRTRPYDVEETAAFIQSVHPTLEIVESRYADWKQVAPLSVLADSNSNGALIVGSPIAAQSREGYAALNVSLKFDGIEKCAATGGNPAKDLLRLLAWLANHCADRCGGLRKGQMVTTGSHTGMLFVGAGTQVTGTFTGLGGATVVL
jgi:2-keto-4-pentenoate hydratase